MESKEAIEMTLFVVITIGIFLPFFCHRTCPKCKKGKLHSEFLDMVWDNMVYKCDHCGERFF